MLDLLSRIESALYLDRLNALIISIGRECTNALDGDFVFAWALAMIVWRMLTWYKDKTDKGQMK